MNHLSLVLCVALLPEILSAAALPDRNNVASQLYGSRAELIHADGNKSNADKVLNGNYDDSSAVMLKGMPSTLQIDFPAPVQINLVRIYPGMTIYAKNPSGDCGIKDYKVEGLNNGYWHPLATGVDQPDFMKANAGINADYFYEHNFKPTTVSALRIIVTRSGFTGKSVSSTQIVPEEKRHAFIRQVEVYEAGKSSSRLAWFNRMVSGDFRLPVYRDQQEAELKLTGSPWLKPTPVTLSVSGEKDAKSYETRKLNISAGEQSVLFKLADYPDGRYIVTISPSDPDSPLKGDLKRMLRVDRGGSAAVPAEPIAVAGQKVFPVDDFHFAKLENIFVRVKPADVREVTRPLDPDRTVQLARGSSVIDFHDDGNYVIQFQDADRTGKNRKSHVAYSNDLSNWRIADKAPDGKANRRLRSPFAPLPVPAIPRWQEKTKLADAKVVFYDRERDGVPALNEIRMQWFPPFAGDASKYGLIKWGTYPVWEKRKGEWLVLSKTPLVVDKFEFEAEELETERDSNDNFAPQFLTDDGKTMFYSRAAKLRRFEPFTIEYDNIRQACRLMRTHYTSDGINWQRRFLALPDENDHWSYQHYGLFSFRVDKDFYVGYLHVYHCVKQQIYPEIIYSRNGLDWKRIPGSQPFVANGPLGSWTFGMIFAEDLPMERDGKYYHVLGSMHRRLHFYDMSAKEDVSFLTGDYLRRSFGGRKLAEQWPFFQEIGGWDGLAEDMRKASTILGLAIYRKNGWIAAEADGSGSLLSRILTAPRATLKINARTAEGGFVKAEVTDADGKALAAYSGDNAATFSGDSTDGELKWSDGKIVMLPESPFRIRLSLEKAQLYSLDFGKGL